MRGHKILIIKTGYSEILDKESNSRECSLGDVLRTTPLLHLYREDKVTWVTDSKAFPLLEGNPLIYRLLPWDFTTALQLESEEFHSVINLEKIPGICALAEKVRARRSRYGFVFNGQTGGAEAYEGADEIIAVSDSAQLKKKNQRTFQELLFEMVGEKWMGERYVFGYLPRQDAVNDVGLNTLVGQKWPTKAWPKEHWDALEKRLSDRGLKITRQDKQPENVLQNLHAYIDWINSSRVIITNDSLGLHVGLALDKQVFGLFGPTPYREVHFYGRGEAIYSNAKRDCVPCFKGSCEQEQACMKDINPEVVFERVINYLERRT
jgi:heptosyltransferase-2